MRYLVNMLETFYLFIFTLLIPRVRQSLGVFAHSMIRHSLQQSIFCIFSFKNSLFVFLCFRNTSQMKILFLLMMTTNMMKFLMRVLIDSWIFVSQAEIKQSLTALLSFFTQLIRVISLLFGLRMIFTRTMPAARAISVKSAVS